MQLTYDVAIEPAPDRFIGNMMVLSCTPALQTRVFVFGTAGPGLEFGHF